MKNKSFASFLAGWMLFFILLWTFIIPMVAIIAGPIELDCWTERRMSYNEKYQPATIYVRVCGLRE